MNAEILATCLLISVGSTCALAQNSGNKSTIGNGPAVQANPASAGETMGQPASAGGNTSGNQGALMEQRQKAMSPQGASNAGATGTMKQ